MSDWSSKKPTGALILDDGNIFKGYGCGYEGYAIGEICFNTAMTGYQEIMTDPSYASQIITFTFPHIGNVGTNLEDIENEAQKIDQMLMCPVCPAESIDQVQVEVAKQMRVKVREMLSEGRERDEILTYFEQRYGSDILAAPPVRGTMVLAWVLMRCLQML